MLPDLGGHPMIYQPSVKGTGEQPDAEGHGARPEGPRAGAAVPGGLGHVEVFTNLESPRPMV